METRIRTIVVGVAVIENDTRNPGRGDEDPVLAPAVELARHLGATLHVVHVFELPQPLLTSYAARALEVGSDFEQRYAAQVKEHLEAQVRRFAGSVAIRCHALEDTTSIRLADFARQVEADLLIVGPNRRGQIWRHFLGSTAERVLHSSPVPVLVLRRPITAPVRRVLLTTDLSEFSAGVHAQAIEEVEALFGSEELELRTLLVVAFDGMLPPPLRLEPVLEAAQEGLDAFLAGQAPAKVPVEGKLRVGEPVREILHEAAEWHADLLVLGTHGRKGVERLLLGSTAAATIRDSSWNVLVIPATAAAERLVKAQRGEAQRMPVAAT